MWWFSKKKNDLNPNAMKKDELIMNILSLEGSIQLTIEKGQDTDIVITNEVLNKKWATGKKSITYTARILLNDDKKTMYLWEVVENVSSGLQIESVVGQRIINLKGEKGKIKGKGYGINGEIMYEYEFDYQATKEYFKKIAQEANWTLKTVLRKSKASY